VRASDDFWPRDPASHTIHIAAVAYNTVFVGEFMQPDWDMFHVSKRSLLVVLSCDLMILSIIIMSELLISLLCWQSVHPMAEYHAAARAVGGCAIYVR
jgi:raffinose synthase